MLLFQHNLRPQMQMPSLPQYNSPSSGYRRGPQGHSRTKSVGIRTQNCNSTSITKQQYNNNGYSIIRMQMPSQLLFKKILRMFQSRCQMCWPVSMCQLPQSARGESTTARQYGPHGHYGSCRHDGIIGTAEAIAFGGQQQSGIEKVETNRFVLIVLQRFHARTCPNISPGISRQHDALCWSLLSIS